MAALAWTEAVTVVTDGHVPDDVYEEARKWFTEVELVNLTVATSGSDSIIRSSIRNVSQIVPLPRRCALEKSPMLIGC